MQAGIPFEDRRVRGDDWDRLKPKPKPSPRQTVLPDWPKVGDRVTQPFLDQLMVSQLLEQNLTLGFFLKGLNGPPGPPGRGPTVLDRDRSNKPRGRTRTEVFERPGT